MTRRPLTIVALVVLAGLTAWRMRPSPSPAKAQERGRTAGASGRAEALLAEGYTVEPETVRQTVPSLGTLRPNEAVTVVAESARRVVAVHFEEGMDVKKGDLLFKLDDAALRADLLRLEGRHALAV